MTSFYPPLPPRYLRSVAVSGSSAETRSEAANSTGAFCNVLLVLRMKNGDKLTRPTSTVDSNPRPQSYNLQLLRWEARVRPLQHAPNTSVRKVTVTRLAATKGTLTKSPPPKKGDPACVQPFARELHASVDGKKVTQRT